MQTIQATYLKYKDFLQILILFAAFRVMTLIMYRPGGYIVDWNDYYFFKSWAQLTDFGYYPYLNFWMEHPPLFPWLVVLAYKISSLIPPWNDPNLPFSITFGALLLPFEIGNLTLLYLIGKKFLEDRLALKACWIYSSLFIPVFFWTAGFDAYPLFFLLLSIFFILRGNAVLAGISTGIGFMIKLIPILVAPVALVTLGSRMALPEVSLPSYQGGFRKLISCIFARRSLLYVICVVITSAIIALPFIVANQTMFLASFAGMLNRSSWETIWALLDGYFGGGGVADPLTRFDPATALVQTHTSSLPWIWITVGFAVLYLLIWTRRIDWRQPKSVLGFVGLTINVFLLYSKGYSPQFLIYVLPFIVLLMPNLKGITYALVLSFLNIIEYPIALIVLPTSNWLLTVTILARTVVILLLSFDYLAIATERYLLVRFSMLRPFLFAITIIGSIVMILGIARDYGSSRLDKSPYVEAITFLSERPSGTLLFTDVDAFRQFTPFLNLHDKAITLDSAGQIGGIITRDQNLWLIYLGTDRDKTLNPEAERSLSEQAFSDETVLFSNALLTHFSTDQLPSKAISATFGNGIELTSYGVTSNPKLGNVLHVQLTWRPQVHIPEDYQVFVHMVDNEGKLVAQKDGTPANGQRPTTGWIPGSDIIDNVSLTLTSDIPPGEYTLQVGLYQAGSGQRLLTASGLDYVEIQGLQIAR